MRAMMATYLIGFAVEYHPRDDDAPRPRGKGWVNMGSAFMRTILDFSDGRRLVGPPSDEVRVIAMAQLNVTDDDLAKSGAMHLFVTDE